ncbi:unnamed protein product [Clavelina lepadiformis]|uniref:Methylmalonic aciduria type A protein, mitochondrial n=1 Tax=Clavelina lepadiformis TaxID=159417 RepID=A0ABP0G9G7_CLALP
MLLKISNLQKTLFLRKLRSVFQHKTVKFSCASSHGDYKFKDTPKVSYEGLYVQDLQNLTEHFDESSFEYRTVQRLYQGLCSSDRASLAESITLVESGNSTKKHMGQTLLQSVMSQMKSSPRESNLTKFFEENVTEKKDTRTELRTMRIGITGPPGAGKSTFIENFGIYLTKKLGLKVAVLAVDPSSNRTGGSLLGDKTRMSQLSVEPMAYVRPSPSQGELGGVARNTMEALLLCEGAGYDVMIIETVGVGQSEVAVADMTDMFVLLIPPAGGDELQGLKRGIIENCDFVLVNKADGDLLPAARKIQTEYTSALKFIPRKHEEWRTRVRRVSSLNGDGIDDLWLLMIDFYSALLASGKFESMRMQQRKIWMWHHIHSDILQRFKKNLSVTEKLHSLTKLVENGDVTPGVASDILLDNFFNKN